MVLIFRKKENPSEEFECVDMRNYDIIFKSDRVDIYNTSGCNHYTELLFDNYYIDTTFSYDEGSDLRDFDSYIIARLNSKFHSYSKYLEEKKSNKEK